MMIALSVTAPPSDSMPVKIGHSVETVTEVTERLSAEVLGNPGVNVLATPMLADLCDTAADQLCGEGVTKCMRINIRHLAATAIGDEVHIIAEVISFTGMLVVCRVVGWDSKRKVVSGHVSRVFI